MVITQELKLDYPCLWEYKLILDAKHNAEVLAREILDAREHKIHPSKKSANSTYKSYTLALLVHSDDDRKELFHLLKSHKQVKFVL